MENNYQYFYFSTGAGVNAITEAVCYPISKFRGMRPNSTTTLDLFFDPIENDDSTSNKFDYVRLTVVTNTHREVFAAISQKLKSRDTWMKIADFDNFKSVSNNITGVAISY